MKIRVLVTGGAGFIGANLCRELVADSRIAEVTVLDDLSTGRKENLQGVPVTLVEGSILDRALLAQHVGRADAVVHLAAVPSVPRSIKDPWRSHEVNATGSLLVLEAARENGCHVVLASSSSVYGANRVLPKAEDLLTMPMSPYAVSKLAAEQYAMAYATCFDLDVLPFRFFNVFGPLQHAGHAYAAVVPAFVDAALAARPLLVHGDGSQSRDFTYVGTVTRVLTTAVTDRTTSGPTNLAVGTRTNLLELIAELERVLDRKLPVEFQPPRVGDVKHSQASADQLLRLFPELEATSLAQGLQETVRWFEACAASSVSPSRDV